ncbi:MAG TPA: serine/threonine-protein kinase [Kofleriaceae bacterium]|nr:serine/threonine-protein kinase [Kofleriaceae bacterium]
MTDDTLPGDASSSTILGVGQAGSVKVRAPGDELLGKLVIERYVIEAQLGKGAFGSVYRGYHAALRRPVAIKVLHAHLLHVPKILQRFRREAELAARLAHINVAGVLDVGETADGRQLIVLELAPGRPLTELLGEPLPAPRVISLVGQILRGLEHAHEAGLVHRDLKPDNIIVEARADGAEIPRIVDFGIAVLADQDEMFGGTRLTATGQMIGTPLYMAPEQARLDAVDHRADLFALGVIVYQMLAGMTPFSGSPVDVALANMGKDPPSIADRAAVDVDPLLERFTRKLMARDVSDRFASARAALAVLELIGRDPEAASQVLGGMNAEKAAAVVALPPPPTKGRGW